MTSNVTIEDIVIPTKTMKSGDLVKTFFEYCVAAGVPALPFRDHNGLIQGFVSLKRVMGKDCLPNYLVELAGILHNDMSCTSHAMEKIHELFQKQVDIYVDNSIQFIASDTILIRTVALMEQYDTNFIFVADGDAKQTSDYKGVVTSLAVAKKMLQIESVENGVKEY